MAKEIYRIGSDIYDASTQQRITGDVWKSGAYAGAKELGNLKAGSLAIPTANDISKYDVTGKINNTLFGTLKPVAQEAPVLPTAKDIPTSVAVGTPTPAPAVVATKVVEDPYSSLVAGAKAIQSAPNPYQQKVDASLADIENINKTYADITNRYRNLVTETGLDTKQTQLSDINKQIVSTSAQYDKTISQVGRDNPTFASIAGGKRSRLAQDKAIEIGRLTAMAQAVQGDIATAQNTIKQTLDTEFSALDRQLEIKKSQLTQNYSMFTAEEKKKADQALQFIDAQKAKLDEQKAEKENIYKVMIAVAGKGADNVTLDAIKNAKSYDEALMAASGMQYISSPADLAGLTESQIFRAADGKIYKRGQNYLETQTKAPDIGVIDERYNPETGQTEKIYGYYDEKTGKVIQTTSNGQPTQPVEQVSEASNYLSQLGGTITQGFDTPTNYIAGRTSHGGYDIALAENSPVKSPVSGTVVEVTKADGTKKGWGNSVVIEDAQKNQWRLAHFNALGVQKWDKVSQSDIVGYLGNTGFVMGEGGGYHLHIEAKDRNGNLFDFNKQASTPEMSENDIAVDIFSGNRPYSEIDKLPKPQQKLARNYLSFLKEQSIEKYKETGDLSYKLASTVGGKQLPAAFNDDIAKKMTVVAELQDLKSDLDKAKSGAWKGRILEKAFWDKDTAIVRQRIQGLIPTIARGVFNEVGVLTDADIENYKKTIPDLKTPEKALDTIYENILGTIERQMTNKFNSYANSKYDVSGFTDDYQNLVTTIESIKGISDEEAQNIADNILNPKPTMETYNRNFQALNTKNPFSN